MIVRVRTFDRKLNAIRKFREMPSEGYGMDYIAFASTTSQAELDALCWTLRREGIQACNAAGEIFVSKLSKLDQLV